MSGAEGSESHGALKEEVERLRQAADEAVRCVCACTSCYLIVAIPLRPSLPAPSGVPLAPTTCQQQNAAAAAAIEDKNATSKELAGLVKDLTLALERVSDIQLIASLSRARARVCVCACVRAGVRASSG